MTINEYKQIAGRLTKKHALKVYIAGGITGVPFYRKSFNRAERALVKKGHSVMNPSVLKAYPEFKYDDYIAVSMAMLKRCNAIFLLRGWEKSNGAKKEFEYALTHDYRIFYSDSDVP